MAGSRRRPKRARSGSSGGGSSSCAMDADAEANAETDDIEDEFCAMTQAAGELGSEPTQLHSPRSPPIPRGRGPFKPPRTRQRRGERDSQGGEEEVAAQAQQRRDERAAVEVRYAQARKRRAEPEPEPEPEPENAPELALEPEPELEAEAEEVLHAFGSEVPHGQLQASSPPPEALHAPELLPQPEPDLPQSFERALDEELSNISSKPSQTTSGSGSAAGVREALNAICQYFGTGQSPGTGMSGEGHAATPEYMADTGGFSGIPSHRWAGPTAAQSPPAHAGSWQSLAPLQTPPPSPVDEKSKKIIRSLEVENLCLMQEAEARDDLLRGAIMPLIATIEESLKGIRSILEPEA